MYITRLYCNKPRDFGPIAFGRGLNVVLGEVRVPSNETQSTHNLGKTTLAKIIDYCLCRGKKKDFFLFKHVELFQGFVFYIEVATHEGQYVTVRRGVENGSKISLMEHDESEQDFSPTPETEWNHFEVGFESGKKLLDGILDFGAIKPWSFRLPVGYALRTQSDFADVFQLAKHAGRHSEWKPYVAHILGFDADTVQNAYDVDEKIEKMRGKIATLRLELGATDVTLDKILGLIELKEQEVTAEEKALDEFDFGVQDLAVNKELVQQIDLQIGELNNERYVLSNTRQRILGSLEAEAIQFKTAAAKRLFEEAGSLFPDQIAKDFDSLIRFNREVSQERVQYLREELATLNTRLDEVRDALAAFNKRRQEELKFLGETDSMEKLREVNKRLLSLKDSLSSLQRQRDALLSIKGKDKELRKLNRKREDLTDEIKSNVDECSGNKEGRYAQIRTKLAAFAQRILGHKALITTKVNDSGNMEFGAEYLSSEDLPTSEAEGKSYQQALCAAYDLAIVDEMLDEDYPRFVYFDGLLEGFDDRIKRNLIGLLREEAEKGIQQILTVIDSDLPITDDGERFAFDEEEVCLVLHDEGDSGRLFRMPSW